MFTAKIDRVNKTITVSRNDLIAAGQFGTPEFEQMMRMRTEFPGYTIVEHKIKRNADKQTYCKLTYDVIEGFIESRETDAQKRAALLKEYETMLLARNMPAVAPQQPTHPLAEAAPTPASVSRQPHDRRLFADYAWEWFESYKVPKLRPGTEMNYRLVIRKHLVPFFGSMRLDEITTVNIQRFYNQQTHKANSSVRCMGIILHGIFDSAIEDSLCVIDPTRSKRLTYSKKKTIREALAIEDAQDIISNLGKLELKDRLLVALLIFTGIRRGEALGLQWEDIDFDRKLINIRRWYAL